MKQDLGIEINFLNNDLAFVFDLFKEHRDKIFVSRNNLPLYAGFAVSASGNVGIVENKGFEASFEYNHQFGKDWTVSLRGNFTMKMKLLTMQSLLQLIHGWRKEVLMYLRDLDI